MEYCIRYVCLPGSVNGMTVKDENGFFNVYINANLDYDTQQKTILHELCHISRDDFFRDEPLEKIESM